MDWKAAKLEYITTDTTYRKIAKKYGVSGTQVASVGKKEDWVGERERYLARTLARSIKKCEKEEADRLADVMMAAGSMIDTINAAVKDNDQFFRHIVSVGDGVQTERVYKKLDTKAMRDTAAVLKDLSAMVRDYYNIPTPMQAEAQRIAAARLEIEQRKAAALDDGDEDNTGVILLPEVTQGDGGR